MSLVGQSIRTTKQQREKENNKTILHGHRQNLGTITFRLISFVGEGREFNPIEFSKNKKQKN